MGTIPEMIVVAIDYQNRMKEYTPTHAEGFQDSGGSDQFVDFIEKELFPYIDSAYSTMPFRILSGHSLAGILVVHLLFSERNIFNAYIAMNPSLWWDNNYITNKTASFKKDTITIGKNPEFIIDHYENFSKQVGMGFPPPEHVIIRSGIRSLYDDKDFLNAINIFNILKGYYPESFEIYKYLAEAYLQNGDKGLALINFKKSLEINPLDDTVKNKIKELENRK